jgi:hypothetical protein
MRLITKTKKSIIKIFAIVLISSSGATYGQNLSDFTGNWILDSRKSENLAQIESSTLTIEQTDSAITFKSNYILKNLRSVNDSITYFFKDILYEPGDNDSYIGAKIVSSNSFSMTNIVASRRYGSMQTFKQLTLYTIDDDRKILEIKLVDILPKESSGFTNKAYQTFIYNKVL